MDARAGAMVGEGKGGREERKSEDGKEGEGGSEERGVVWTVAGTILRALDDS